MPIFPFAFIPSLVRLVLTVVLAAILGATLDELLLKQLSGEIKIAVLASEFFLGILLSLGFHAASASLHMMGQLIEVQTGLAAAATFDPATAQENSTTGTLFSLMLVAVFFQSGMQYDFLAAFGELFRVAPPGGVYGIDGDFFHRIAEIFVTGFIVASPVIIVLWLVDVCLSIVSRSMPQAQIYFVALPLKILLSFMLLGLTLGASNNTLYALLKDALHSWVHLVKL